MASAKYYILYHYTSDKGHRGILSEKMIRASGDDGRDARYGEGVYLTSLDPSNDIRTIAKNNWDGCEYNLRRLCDLFTF